MSTTDRYNDEMRADENGTSYNDVNADSTTVAAVFADRDSAHGVVHELHDEGFRDTWIGITRRDDDAAGYASTEPTVRPSD